MKPLAIVNEFGNVDLTSTTLNKRYVHVRGKRLQPLCRKLGIRYAEAVVGFEKRRHNYWRAVKDGVVISARSHKKLLQEIEAREQRNPPEKVEAARIRKQEKRLKTLSDAGISDPDSLRAKWYERGQISSWEAQLIEFKTTYRHNHTDYDLTIEKLRQEAEKCHGIERRERFESLRFDARAQATEFPIPVTWEEYLQRYDFPYPEIAKALARTLRSPIEAHPNWFCEAVLAVARAELDLDRLGYSSIQDAIANWRCERSAESDF